MQRQSRGKYPNILLKIHDSAPKCAVPAKNARIGCIKRGIKTEKQKIPASGRKREQTGFQAQAALRVMLRITKRVPSISTMAIGRAISQFWTKPVIR